MCGQPTAKLNLGSAQSVAAVLRKHVLFELEDIDRMYLKCVFRCCRLWKEF
jgi:hypothetical protein